MGFIAIPPPSVRPAPGTLKVLTNFYSFQVTPLRPSPIDDRFACAPPPTPPTAAGGADAAAGERRPLQRRPRRLPRRVARAWRQGPCPRPGGWWVQPGCRLRPKLGSNPAAPPPRALAPPTLHRLRKVRLGQPGLEATDGLFLSRGQDPVVVKEGPLWRTRSHTTPRHPTTRGVWFRGGVLTFPSPGGVQQGGWGDQARRLAIFKPRMIQLGFAPGGEGVLPSALTDSHSPVSPAPGCGEGRGGMGACSPCWVFLTTPGVSHLVEEKKAIGSLQT